MFINANRVRNKPANLADANGDESNFRVLHTPPLSRSNTIHYSPDGRNATGWNVVSILYSRFENIGTTNAADTYRSGLEKAGVTRGSGTKRLRVAFVEKRSLLHRPSTG